MKKVIIVLLCLAMLLVGCNNSQPQTSTQDEGFRVQGQQSYYLPSEQKYYCENMLYAKSTYEYSQDLLTATETRYIYDEEGNGTVRRKDVFKWELDETYSKMQYSEISYSYNGETETLDYDRYYLIEWGSNNSFSKKQYEYYADINQYIFVDEKGKTYNQNGLLTEEYRLANNYDNNYAPYLDYKLCYTYDQNNNLTLVECYESYNFNMVGELYYKDVYTYQQDTMTCTNYIVNSSTKQLEQCGKSQTTFSTQEGIKYEELDVFDTNSVRTGHFKTGTDTFGNVVYDESNYYNNAGLVIVDGEKNLYQATENGTIFLNTYMQYNTDLANFVNIRQTVGEFDANGLLVHSENKDYDDDKNEFNFAYSYSQYQYTNAKQLNGAKGYSYDSKLCEYAEVAKYEYTYTTLQHDKLLQLMDVYSHVYRTLSEYIFIED